LLEALDLRVIGPSLPASATQIIASARKSANGRTAAPTAAEICTGLPLATVAAQR